LKIKQEDRSPANLWAKRTKSDRLFKYIVELIKLHEGLTNTKKFTILEKQ